MARKSNKTAHVLNLLAGHDAAKEADEQASPGQGGSGETAIQAAQNAPDTATAQAAPAAPGGTTAQAAPTAPSGTGTAAGNAVPASTPAPPPAPAPAPVAPAPNNIAVIDKTEDDPVAELIQQKLSSEFEKQIQQTRPEASTIPEALQADAQSKADAMVSEVSAENVADKVPVVPETTAEPSVGTTPAAEAAIPDVPVSDIDVNTAAAAESAPVPASTPVEEPVPESTAAPQAAATVPAPEPAPAPQTAAPTPEPAPAPQAAAPAPEPAPQPVSEPEPEPEPELDFASVNVMEHIVKDKIIYFMRQFEVCTCERCKADVIALALNGLMPKYIVTPKAAVDPLLSYYTNRLISDVTVEATKACMTVKENPRH